LGVSMMGNPYEASNVTLDVTESSTTALFNLIFR